MSLEGTTTDKKKFKVGDKVVIKSNAFPDTISTVKKITPQGNVRLEEGGLFSCYGGEIRKRRGEWDEYRAIEKIEE